VRCLNHLIVIDGRHLWGVLAEFADYYNRERPHRSLGLQSPLPAASRPVAGWRRDRFWAACITCTHGPLGGWGFAVLRLQRISWSGLVHPHEILLSPWIQLPSAVSHYASAAEPSASVSHQANGHVSQPRTRTINLPQSDQSQLGVEPVAWRGRGAQDDCFRSDVGRRGARALDAMNTTQAAVMWHSTVGMASL
jgi:hypothetical protein